MHKISITRLIDRYWYQCAGYQLICLTISSITLATSQHTWPQWRHVVRTRHTCRWWTLRWEEVLILAGSVTVTTVHWFLDGLSGILLLHQHVVHNLILTLWCRVTKVQCVDIVDIGKRISASHIHVILLTILTLRAGGASTPIFGLRAALRVHIWHSERPPAFKLYMVLRACPAFNPYLALRAPLPPLWS